MQVINKECIGNMCSKLGYDLSEKQIDMVIQDLKEQGIIKDCVLKEFIESKISTNKNIENISEKDITKEEFETTNESQVEEAIEEQEILEKLFF